ncbi:hypothetical protein KAM479_41020 [Aeromonas caviae]|nr:hypothetical protein KAM479_41020 [Aeromonas caviae]
MTTPFCGQLSGEYHLHTNWLPVTEIPKHYPQFNYPTLKVMFWKRAEKPGLERCCRIVGRRMFVNTKLFGLWMAGGLSEQHPTDD